MVLSRWAERTVLGEPPQDAHWRRNIDAILDGRRLVVLGAPSLTRSSLFSPYSCYIVIPCNMSRYSHCHTSFLLAQILCRIKSLWLHSIICISRNIS